MALCAHPGLTEAGSVDTGILPVVKGLLRDGPWYVSPPLQPLGHLLYYILSRFMLSISVSDCEKKRS